MAQTSFPEIFSLIQSGLNNIEQGITIFDRDLNLVFANKHIEHLLGFPAELLNDNCTFEKLIKFNCERGEYGPGDKHQQIQDRIKEAKKFTEHTIERTRPNGTILRISGSPLGDGGFATIYTDITQERLKERRLEQRISDQLVDIQRSEERLRLIANEVPAGIAYLNTNEVFEFANRRFANAYGFRSSEILGKKSYDILSEEVYKTSKEFFTSAKAGENCDFDHEFLDADGKVLNIRTFLRADIGEDEKVNGFYTLSINVTKHIAAAAALSQAQKMEAIGRLSSGIAHDFNNMLTVILGNLNPLKNIVENDDVREEMILPAIRAAQNGAGLTKQLLTLARRQNLEPRPVNLVDIITNLESLIASSLKENIKCRTKIDTQDAWTFADAGQLENSLVNLIFNARDAIESQGEIVVSLNVIPVDPAERSDLIELGNTLNDNVIRFSDSEQVCISVQDNGSGIKQEIIKKIFDPFFSTKLNQNGSGLGLSMVQSFVEKSHGSISIQSELNSGSTFTIKLPLINLLQPIANIENPERFSSQENELALVVDDHADVRKAIRYDLMNLGFTVVEAENAAEGYELINQIDSITTIVSDIDMPGEDSGIDLIKRIKQTHPHLRTVLMTGHGELASDQMQIEGCKVLNKPFRIKSLSDALIYSQDFIDNHRRLTKDTDKRH